MNRNVGNMYITITICSAIYKIWSWGSRVSILSDYRMVDRATWIQSQASSQYYIYLASPGNSRMLLCCLVLFASFSYVQLGQGCESTDVHGQGRDHLISRDTTFLSTLVHVGKSVSTNSDNCPMAQTHKNSIFSQPIFSYETHTY
jgi:hypothetical protein